MKLLVLGGTVFLGRALVEEALSRGHEVTIFTRGQHNPDLFPQVERLRGDRSVSLELLRGRQWDAVVDTSGYFPRVVRMSAELLAGSVQQYVFISSLSVYSDLSAPSLDESSPVGTLEDPTVEEITEETYGPLKVLCEQAAQETVGAGTTIVRPGLIVGPHDPSDRFTYWPCRAHRGGEILGPGRPDRTIEIIDVGDLAAWTLHLCETGTTGVYNATGPNYPLTMERLIQACVEAADSESNVTWVPDEFLVEQGVGPWMELPLWIPEEPEVQAFYATDFSRALAAGLTFRPVEDTVEATLQWALGRTDDSPPRAGLDPEREREVLQAWHARAGA